VEGDPTGLLIDLDAIVVIGFIWSERFCLFLFLVLEGTVMG
jgi:hypothetical protein